MNEYLSYDKIDVWNKQRQFFNKYGENIWKKWYIPFDITSNSAYVNQVVELFLDKLEKDKHKNKEVKILEIWTWLGLFSINFVNLFEEVCKERKLNYYKNLTYYATDYSITNLKYLSNLNISNSIKVWRLDVLNDIKISNLNWVEETVNNFDFVIMNYVFCCMPLQIYKKEDNKIYQKYFKNKKSEFLEYEKSFYNNYFKFKNDGIIIIPTWSIESLDNIYNNFLEKKWAIFIADAKEKLKFQNPINYWDSIFHKVNFDYLDFRLNKENKRHIRTENNKFQLEYLFISNSDFETFQNIFISKNLNEELYLELKNIYKLIDWQEYKIALEKMYKVYPYRKNDTNMSYRLYFLNKKLWNISESEKYFNLCKKFDYFNIYN